MARVTGLRMALAGAAAIAGIGGCFVVTGGTGGYVLEQPDAGVCGFDAATLGVTVSCACASAADCRGDGGGGKGGGGGGKSDGGGSGGGGGARVCCLGLGASSTLSSTCQAPSCGDAAIQICATSAECDAQTCVKQSCTYGGFTVPVQACGALPGCTQ